MNGVKMTDTQNDKLEYPNLREQMGDEAYEKMVEKVNSEFREWLDKRIQKRLQFYKVINEIALFAARIVDEPHCCKCIDKC